jgi:hypothetical protein
MNRRGFVTGLAGILVAGVAPAIVRASSIMPVLAPLPVEYSWKWIHGEGGILSIDVECLDAGLPAIWGATLRKPADEESDQFVQRAFPLLRSRIEIIRALRP